MSNLGIFICTFILATCCLYSHWDQRYAMFRSQVGIRGDTRWVNLSWSKAVCWGCERL